MEDEVMFDPAQPLKTIIDIIDVCCPTHWDLLFLRPKRIVILQRLSISNRLKLNCSLMLKEMDRLLLKPLKNSLLQPIRATIEIISLPSVLSGTQCVVESNKVLDFEFGESSPCLHKESC